MLKYFDALLESTEKSVRKEVCWALSNITAGSSTQIEKVMQTDIFRKLVHMVQNDEMDIKKEASWVLSNATAGAEPPQIAMLVNLNVLQALCRMLKVNDARVLAVVLEGITHVLTHGKKSFMKGSENPFATIVDECGALDNLENLQRHPNQQIYDKVIPASITICDLLSCLRVDPEDSRGILRGGRRYLLRRGDN